MKKNYYLLLIGFLFISCIQEKEEIIIDWSSTQKQYATNISNSKAYLDSLLLVAPNDEEAKLFFIRAREEFKKGEAYASYLNPEVGHKANGPALPLYKEDTGKIMRPFGLQKIEESIYDGGTSKEQFHVEVKLTKGLLTNLENYINDKPLTPKRFFIATQQQLFRILSHGISGFDTPVSHLGLTESAISLLSLKDAYAKTLQTLIKSKDASLDDKFNRQIALAVDYINAHQDFNTFDRYTFIREYLNPITISWTAIRNTSGLWENVNNNPFNFEAKTFFEKNTFNTNYFTTPIDRNPSKEKIALGKELFNETRLATNGNMACVTCHVPEKGYSDGLVANLDNTGNLLKRNTPTLINSIFQKSFFWDGRSPTLSDQITSVFTNEKEFDSNVHQFSNTILNDTVYQKKFNDVFPNTKLKNIHIVKAISAYVGTLNGFDSKFDKNMRGEEESYTQEEKLGLNLFMGKALCATCHFMPLTNGTVPPFFMETEKEVIGVPENYKNDKLDDDLGFYWMYNEELHRGMFKTPTVRNAAITAPYMHNGAYETLEQVMDFYNRGGGSGMGFDLERQTLPFDELNLTEKEQKALVTFMKTLTDSNVDVY